jgi:DNA-binding CsgD family transcriptional regulator
MQGHGLTWFAGGLSLAHIAQTAGSSRTSVATHLKSVRFKLNKPGQARVTVVTP